MSTLFRGAPLGTILRNDTYLLQPLGNFLERADNTARILDVKYYVLLAAQRADVGGEIDSVAMGGSCARSRHRTTAGSTDGATGPGDRDYPDPK